MDAIRTDELIAKAKDGDEEAFAKLYEIYNGEVFSVAYNITGVLEDAEEIVQEVMLTVWSKLRSYKKTSAPFESWLKKVAANQSKMFLRAKLRKDLTEEEYCSPSPYSEDDWNTIKPTARPGVDYALY